MPQGLSPHAQLTIRPPGFFMNSMTLRKTPSTTRPPASPARGEATGKPRRTQVERSTETQLKLCQAAVDLLSEVGYERLTTAQIAQRAGVSKGAQAHHYPSKDDMLVAAFQHLLAQWEDRRESYASRREGATTMADLLQNMWSRVFGRPDYLASIEVMLAVRHHPALRDRLQAVLKTWTVARDETFRILVPAHDPEALATFLQINFCVLRGLALYEGLADDRKLPKRVMAMWTEIATDYALRLQRPAAPTPTRRRPAPTRSPSP